MCNSWEKSTKDSHKQQKKRYVIINTVGYSMDEFGAMPLCMLICNIKESVSDGLEWSEQITIIYMCDE